MNRGIIGFALFFLLASCVRADSLSTVANYLDSNASILLLGGTADDLATNLLNAQAVANLGQPDSLALSETAVLRAIWLESQVGVTECDLSNCAIVWEQSNVAINDLVSVSLTPSSLNFGNKNIDPPVQTPEPPVYVLLVFGLTAIFLFWRK